MDLESQFVYPLPLRLAIWSPPKDRGPAYVTNMFLHTTFRIWDKWRGRQVAHPSLVQPLSHFLSNFPRMSADLEAKFATANIVSLGDLVGRNYPRDKLALDTRLHSSIPWFLFFQIRSFLDDPSV